MRRNLGVLLASAAMAAAGVGGMAAAQTAPQPAANGRFLVTMQKADAAQPDNPPGTVDLRCTTTKDLRARGCVVIDEAPVGLGFGDAALEMAHLIRFAPGTAAGQALIVPVDFCAGRTGRACQMPPPPAPAVEPQWARTPTDRDFARVYPTKARGTGLEGQVRVRCKVTAGGLMDQCVLAHEKPANAGFGQAALRLTPLFQARTTLADGTSVVGRSVDIPVKFGLQCRGRPCEISDETSRGG